MNRIKALIFDQDGVIIDTEKDGHRVAFNKTFKEFGFQFEWDEDYYHELLQIAGGKERMKHHFNTRGFGKPVKKEDLENLIKSMHKRKTEIFINLIKEKALPLRPGVKRIMQEGMDKGLKIGICTTSNERAAHAIAYEILDDIKFDFVLAGDIVMKKKPDPEIYFLALKETKAEPRECIVIEDSRNGLLAAKAAGMNVVVTTNYYTEKENLAEADIIVTCLGELHGERGKLTQGDSTRLNYNGVLYLEQLIKYFEK